MNSFKVVEYVPKKELNKSENNYYMNQQEVSDQINQQIANMEREMLEMRVKIKKQNVQIQDMEKQKQLKELIRDQNESEPMEPSINKQKELREYDILIIDSSRNLEYYEKLLKD